MTLGHSPPFPYADWHICIRWSQYCPGVFLGVVLEPWLLSTNETILPHLPIRPAEVVHFYDRRFAIGYTEQEKQDLVNFLSVL
jgi:hypothetical protein